MLLRLIRTGATVTVPPSDSISASGSVTSISAPPAAAKKRGGATRGQGRGGRKRGGGRYDLSHLRTGRRIYFSLLRGAKALPSLLRDEVESVSEGMFHTTL